MAPEEFNVRLNHNGQFKKSSYVGGEVFVVTRVELDLFSYTVLMEFVKDYLHYTEIGGVYILDEENGGWKLITTDKDVMEVVQGYDNGEEVEFYIDNTVDENIEPLNQMQPHVVIRPRKNIIQGTSFCFNKHMIVVSWSYIFFVIVKYS